MIGITNLTKKPKPRISWKKVKDKILGKEYDLSLVLAEDKLMKELNEKHRKKNEVANTLSFPLEKQEGEVFLNINCSKKELEFLFVHSLLHLKGLKHGEKMANQEKKYYNIYNEIVK